MQKLTRRRFVGAAGAASVVPLVYVSKAFGAEFTLKYANNSPVTHPLNIRATEATERIKQETNGRGRDRGFSQQPARRRHRHARASCAPAPSISSRCPA